MCVPCLSAKTLSCVAVLGSPNVTSYCSLFLAISVYKNTTFSSCSEAIGGRLLKYYMRESREENIAK